VAAALAPSSCALGDADLGAAPREDIFSAAAAAAAAAGIHESHSPALRRPGMMRSGL
jgi:hypothetical protein